MKREISKLRQNKNFLCALTLFLFICLATASTVNKLYNYSFNTHKNYEEKIIGSYVVKNDGTRIYGKEVEWKSGLLVKDRIEQDGQAFKISDIIGYYQG